VIGTPFIRSAAVFPDVGEVHEQQLDVLMGDPVHDAIEMIGKACRLAELPEKLLCDGGGRGLELVGNAVSPAVVFGLPSNSCAGESAEVSYPL
jgi:hypothetical protein